MEPVMNSMQTRLVSLAAAALVTAGLLGSVAVLFGNPHDDGRVFTTLRANGA